MSVLRSFISLAFLALATVAAPAPAIIDILNKSSLETRSIANGLTPIASAASQALADTFNAAIPGIVATRVAAGHSVLVVDMMNYLTVSDLDDGLHPTDAGYNLMAEAWYAGIQQAASNGWINAPVAAGGVFLKTGAACTAELYWDPLYHQIASGVGSGDVAFGSSWIVGGTVAGGYVGTGNTEGAGVRLADLNGDGKDDYAWVDPVTGAVTLDLNGGYTTGSGVNWIYKGIIASGIGDGPGVMFADINGDGFDDYLWVAPGGDVTAYINGGENPAGGWIWEPLGVICHDVGGTRATTRFADIDGDGRAEYIIVGADGSLTAWFNSGFSNTPVWELMGEIATGIGGGADGAGVFLQDLNGDGHADYIWLNSIGAATVYINQRGPSTGLAPSWIPAGVIATGVGTSRDNITFGDMDGDGKKDYVFVHADTGELDCWFNKGSGGAYVTGDGTRFADMNGDGLDDYMWLAPNGAITLYQNDQYSQSAGEWIWVPQGVIASGIAARKDIRLADLDGDGLADYLIVDETTGAVHFWQNGGANSAAPGGWIWTPQGELASGVGANGLCIQFADTTGSGRSDYLDVTPSSGAVTMWYNGCSGQSGLGLTGHQTPPTWQEATCENAGVINAALDQTTRWNDLDTDSAWAAAVANWTSNPFPGGLTFTEQVSNFFNGPENMLCGETVDHNGCGTTVECSDVNHPAGYFILNSLEQISDMNLNFYDAVVRVEAAITADMSKFATTFSPIAQESEVEKLILDLVGLGFALAASPKQLPYFKENPNTLGTLKDDVNPLVSNGITISKDTAAADGSPLSTQNTLETSVSNMIVNWYNSINAVNVGLFDGSAASIAQLQLMTTQGQLLEPTSTLTDLQIQQFMENSIYGYLIPQAWALSNTGIYPFILDSGFDCSAVNPLPKYMSNAVGDATYTCYENRLYYLMSTTGVAQTCDTVPCGVSKCTNNFFSAPSGLSVLDGTVWGGVTRDDFTIGSVAGYQANNNQNGWPAADPTNPATVSALYDSSLKTPGIMMIPVCSPDVAFYNWQVAEFNTANYPCTPIPADKKRGYLQKREEVERLRREAIPC